MSLHAFGKMARRQAQTTRYLKRKQVQPHGLRITGDGRLMVPMLSPDGELTSLQYIGADGDKKYHPWRERVGLFWRYRRGIGSGANCGGLCHRCNAARRLTGKQAYIAFSASNIPKVAVSCAKTWAARRVSWLLQIMTNTGSGETTQTRPRKATARPLSCRQQSDRTPMIITWLVATFERA